MMKYFPSKSNTMWSEKVNFVDQNNVFLGYNFSQNCCEDFGWYISETLEKCINEENLLSDQDSEESVNSLIQDFVFDKTFYLEHHGEGYDEGQGAIFRIVSEDKELFICIYNKHNGYYGHGFEFLDDINVIKSGYL